MTYFTLLLLLLLLDESFGLSGFSVTLPILPPCQLWKTKIDKYKRDRVHAFFLTDPASFSAYERRTKLLADLFSHGMTLNLC